MKHVITITKQDFIESDYVDNENCALAKALKRHFPKATNIIVDSDSFRFDHPKFGHIDRDFTSCEIVSCDHEVDIEHYPSEYMEWAICEMAGDYGNENPYPACDLTFNFITA